MERDSVESQHGNAGNVKKNGAAEKQTCPDPAFTLVTLSEYECFKSYEHEQNIDGYITLKLVIEQIRHAHGNDPQVTEPETVEGVKNPQHSGVFVNSSKDNHHYEQLSGIDGGQRRRGDRELRIDNNPGDWNCKYDKN